ncbi:MAG: hypothetical protein OXG39_04780 [Chloroflexi bacterium]|nr:hypothetical protein [Chloroflexota bacterium]
MKLRFRFSAIVVDRLLIGIVLALVLATALVVWQLPAPHLAFNYKETAIDVRADKAWSLGPGDCFQITWHLEGSQSIHIEGVERRESGQASFCPAVFSPSPSVELTDHGNGFYRSYSLKTYYAPDVAANVLSLAALAFFPLLAAYFFWTNDLERRPAMRAIFLAMLALCLCLVALRLTGWPLTIVSVLAILRGVFSSVSWQYFGVAAAAVFYLSLAIQALWQGLRHRRSADFVVVSSFLLFIGLLYLPFGFDTIGHWEEWFNHGFFEGEFRPRRISELVQRFSFLWPSAIGNLLNSESFSGHNTLYALFLWGKLAIFYGIMRCCGVRRLYAYLITMLFGVYPVDSNLMNLRSIALQFSIVNLLAAIYLVLHYLKNPTRTRLAGVLLALAISIGAYEAQYALILVFPLLWWRRIRVPAWREINLTIIWYLAPALKLTYLVLLVLTGRGFYRSNYVYAGTEFSDNLIPTTIGNLLTVYRRTFVVGWSDALADLGRNSWLLLTFAMVALVGAVTWYLWKREPCQSHTNERKMILGFLTGLLLIVPAVGVLIWFSYYSQGLWRLYLYVPGPAAIALFSLIALMASRIPSERFRYPAIMILCLLLIVPAVSRLILQHEHFVVSANNKKHVLQQIVQIAPEMNSQTRVLVLSDMPAEVRLSKHIEEMKSNMIGSAMYVIHGGGVSGLGSMCLSAENCYPISNWVDHLSDTLVFLLHDDLSLELVREPKTIFSEFRGLNYDVTRLYNPDAPLPQRAYTMLGLTKP